MAAAIETANGSANVSTVPGSKGDFIVTIEGKEVWNKLSHPEKRFPEHGEILNHLAPNS